MDLTNKNYQWLNFPLALLAVFNIALTLYCCTQFYAYLPTSDTWVYVDFLAQAAQGHLDLGALFEKHNGVHVIALPKLVYFLDMWLTGGSGALTVLISLLAQLASIGIFFSVIKHTTELVRHEKLFWSMASVVFLLSACQAESFLNPANLQWSLLVFSASLAAWGISSCLREKQRHWIAVAMLGVLLTGLTSASPFLILLPFAVILIQKMPAKKIIFAGFLLALSGSVVLGIIFAQYNISWGMLPALFINILKFVVAFMAPPVERLHSLLATSVTGMLLALALWKVLPVKLAAKSGGGLFFLWLLWFALLLILAAGITRAYIPSAFTFRFVNIGLLFSLTLFICLYLRSKGHWAGAALLIVTFVYLLLLSYINYTEASAFAYGRNHVRLNQVAYALDIREPGVVSALPGTVWEKADFDFVQANKHQLAEQGLGIYSDEAYQRVGSPVAPLLANRVPTACQWQVLKMRRLLPEQAAYKLTGTTRSANGRTLSQVYFVDDAGVIRGFAIPIVPSRSLWDSITQGRQWSGFVNLDGAADTQNLRVYAYEKAYGKADGKDVICEPLAISLPDHVELPAKKQKSGIRPSLPTSAG